MSLKSILTQLIKDRNGGVYTLEELEDYCHKYPAKISQAERRLRPSESPNIESVWNKKHTAIIGYRYAFQNLTSETLCCPSYQLFQVHAQDCKNEQPKSLFT